MKRLIKSMFQRFGFDLVRFNPGIEHLLGSVPDLSDEERAIIARAYDYTMTGVERMAALINAVNYVTAKGISGDIAECGVWRGGSMMTVALTLLARGDLSRTLYLYDTFEGMSAPADADVSHDGVAARTVLAGATKDDIMMCYASIEDVRANILSTGYPEDKVRLIKGRVEETIPATIPSHLALLRLDTDWYESTKHELSHLYPRLDTKGILIIDDYGYWQGARKAVDEYFGELGEDVYLHRIDHTGRILVRNGA